MRPAALGQGGAAGRPAPGAERPQPRAVHGALLALAALLATYLLTLAPGVTLWDGGELIAAMHGFGIPHPPGTPLYVALGRAWTVLLAPLGVAAAANLLSAVATAAAVALAALLVAGRGGAAAVLAAALAAGGMATLWRNATETEVYALALLLAVLTLVAAERAGRSGPAGGSGHAGWLLLVAYLLGLAIPLHQFALVAAPAALLLAGTGRDGRLRADVLLALLGVLLVVAGLGTARPTVALMGLGVTGLATALAHRARRAAGPDGAGAVGRGTPAALVLVALLGLSALAILPLRAALDPALNQGNPASWPAFLDVLARRQYAVAPLWPRQAPLWLQLGNVVEYADWQVALGLSPGPAPGWRRTPLTLLFALLGLYGALEHRRLDRRVWRAMLVLLLAASVGVVLYLNLKAGPSFGAGVLPAGAPREARERDYFFVFAFLVWGLWAGLGAVRLSARLLAGRRWPGALLAALPLALNAPAVDRARGADAVLARDVAVALLRSAPPRAILLTAGDNDTYPLWYLQQVEGVRPDVLVVVTSLLPAAWYRDELARRDGLGARTARGAPWYGLTHALASLDSAARRQGRAVAVSALVPRHTRALLAGPWVLGGVSYERERARVPAGTLSGPGAPPGPDSAPAVDRVRARAVAPLVRRQLDADGLPLPAEEAAARTTRRLLACAALAAREPTPASIGLLASWCDRR